MLSKTVRIKTFMNDHTCPRETKNRLANRKWLACQLVKKLRKYPNLKHSEVAQYFKSKCDLDLNKSSLTRALEDARAVVYGDTAAQYGMVRDYRLTLLKRANRGKKQNTSLKRNYKKGNYRYCGETGHTKRNYDKKVVDEESAVVTAAAAITATHTNVNGDEVNNSAPNTTVDGSDATLVPQAQIEIQLDLSQLKLMTPKQVQPLPVHPTKLPPKKKLSTLKSSTLSTSTLATTTQLPSTPPANTLQTSIPPVSIIHIIQCKVQHKELYQGLQA
ncbi:hypothetical protein Ahy_B08g090292 [Arachis hypogaea]|uniref:Uncharacterized protein n=1 Tax=Arachis hypogaea TaxID=3818 RepID=A0A444XZY6_ARAHY|nr:hypothetical protein Ahy_B08g090292 [Arachis hypogaea]